MWLACSKDNYYESYPGHKIKNAIKCTLKEFTRFLNTIFQLQKLLRKAYRAKVSTADSLYMYVVEGKITLVAVMQKSF